MHGVVRSNQSRQEGYSPFVTIMRRCSRTACANGAVATLTYVYADQTAVLGRLATFAEPHTYDLCADHARGLTAPRGWQVVRLISGFEEDEPYLDDLLAVANAVEARPGRRRTSSPAGSPEVPTAGDSPDRPRSRPHPEPGAGPGATVRHLRILRDG